MTELRKETLLPTLSAPFSEAIAFAAEIHAEQRRKGTRIPYVSHLLAVAGLVLENGGGEVEAIGALLHDAAEDHGGHAMLEIIRRRFGEDVAEIVAGCSDTLESRKPVWRARKEAFVARLEEASPSTRRVVAADKLHNLRCLLSDVRSEGARAFDRFETSTRDDQAWYYTACAEALLAAEDSVLARRVAGAARRLEKAVDRLNAEDARAAQGSLFDPRPTIDPDSSVPAVSAVEDPDNPDLLQKDDLARLVDNYFDESSLAPGTEPRLVLLMGPVATGKTRMRRSRYGRGYVVLDAAEIFNDLSRGHYFDFPDGLEEPMEAVGSQIARRAIQQRHNIVTEVIGDNRDELTQLITFMGSVGYHVDVQYVHCDVETALERNRTRGDDNISAYYTQPYHFRWLVTACQALRPESA
jgi:hypothetical protein